MTDPPSPQPHPQPSAVLVRSLWQVLVYVLGTVLVASWVWVWQTNNTLRDQQAALMRMPEIMLRAEANRSVIDVYAVRITKLEEAAQRARDDRQATRLAMSGLTAKLHELQIDHGRMLEILRMGAPQAARPQH